MFCLVLLFEDVRHETTQVVCHRRFRFPDADSRGYAVYHPTADYRERAAEIGDWPDRLIDEHLFAVGPAGLLDRRAALKGQVGAFA